MGSYDPNASRPSDDWLQTDEGERIEQVSSYHRRKKIQLPSAQLPAVIHVVVGNELALEDEVVVETLARLQSEGLIAMTLFTQLGPYLLPICMS